MHYHKKDEVYKSEVRCHIISQILH